MRIGKHLKQRYSERDFDDRIVSMDLVEQLALSFIQAPTSCNLQIHNLTLVNDPNLLTLFAKNVTGKVNWAKQLFILTVDSNLTFENNANYISAGMAVENLMLESNRLGLATCPLAGFKGHQFIKDSLGIPNELDIPLIILFGYPKVEGKSSSTYRKPLDYVLGVNQYCIEKPFPKTSYMNDWTEEQIRDYRTRILSVYFPRTRQGVWNSGLNILWDLTKEKIGDRNIYFFPSEKNEFDMLNTLSNKLVISDEIPVYTDYLKNQFADVSVLGEINDKKSDTAFVLNKLMFCKNPDGVIKNINKNVQLNGLVYVSEFNKYGSVALCYSVLRALGFQKHVYHNSSFYKFGPFNFINHSILKASFEKNGFEIIDIRKLDTKALYYKLPRKLRFIDSIWRKLHKESTLYTLKKTRNI
ncbi:nitroreductase family protein [Vibrio tritonius]|uniref:Nitroreductase family protein n=1 Tax=Vibrio tritonius TaxID=1435069 RepID=A0ABS7YN79_9VIBR|nr:nitroreductase family protein [Vibrio tritonius]MCA2015714.1 nitroreductase family protein [Vibrio tritonius]